MSLGVVWVWSSSVLCAQQFITISSVELLIYPGWNSAHRQIIYLLSVVKVGLFSLLFWSCSLLLTPNLTLSVFSSERTSHLLHLYLLKELSPDAITLCHVEPTTFLKESPFSLVPPSTLVFMNSLIYSPDDLAPPIPLKSSSFLEGYITAWILRLIGIHIYNLFWKNSPACPLKLPQVPAVPIVQKAIDPSYLSTVSHGTWTHKDTHWL